MRFNRIESIVFGGRRDHNFWSPAITVKNTNYFNNNKEVVAQLMTYNPNELDLQYSLSGKMLNDHTMSLQISMDTESEPWIVPDAI